MLVETWKDIVGYEGRYQVSDQGRIKSLPNSRRFSELVMKLAGHPKTGHYICNLTDQFDGKWRQKSYFVHTLELAAFVGERPEGFEGCHNDGNPQNNALTNLRWDTTSSNQMDRVAHGTSNRGVRNRAAKLDEATARWIKSRLTAGEKVGALAEEFGLWHGAISAIKNERTWAWL